MAIVLFAAIGFASLRNASDVWAQTMFTVAFVALLLSTLGAIAFKGEGRVLLSGFAIFGWGRLLISTQTRVMDSVFGFGAIPAPSLLTARVFAYLLPYFSSSRGFDGHHAQVFFSLEIILFGLIGSVVGSLMARWNERANP
jgi:hypothetical protein